MAAVQNGHVNGINGHSDYPSHERFSDIPPVIDIPVRGDDGDEAVNLDLTELLDETDELCDLLENENAAKTYWVTIALAYAKQSKVNIAIDILQKGLKALQKARAEDRLSILTCLCWLFLWRCRHAPRVKPTQATEDDRTKEYFISAATSTLNDASRINPSYQPLFLARGALYLLRASLQPTRSGHGTQDSERADTLKQASKCFDDAYRFSNGKSIMAQLGKAKVLFSLGKMEESLKLYQQVLERAPDMIDPDPRIGIGCCLWQLDHKELAKSAWQRALELNPKSKIANVLMGLFYLHESNQLPTTDPQFMVYYKKAMTDHVQEAFKNDDVHALTCATFGGYFIQRKAWANAERLARRAIEQTDVNAIASDGWYLLARKEHYDGDLAKASDYYTKADLARGGDDKGYLPAKFGVAQLKTVLKDVDGAKFRLDKMASAKDGSVEAKTLLGILFAEDVYANQAASVKEDKSSEHRRAITLLEQVRAAWKDPKKKASPDSAVLLNLARLYEADQPDRALACLQQVEQIQQAEVSDDDIPEDASEEDAQRLRREQLSPQLLNNIGCFQFQAERHSQARDDFQTALNACVKMSDRDPEADTDALVTTISYNLARTYEAENLFEEAKKVYSGLLERHPDYVDANTRLAYIALRADPAEGEQAIKQLLESDPSNLDVRALYGWWLHKTKKRTLQLNEDQEQRHFKHTLQTYDKHDLYSLVGMGNLNLAVAREMRRDTDQDKERRSKMYMRAVEFFDKVLTLDPRNAFAAQGLGIAMVEDKKDTTAGIQIFSKVRESIKASSASVHVNLGHIFAETKQWSRSIENYELALQRANREQSSTGLDPHILACLGRVWLLRGRQEKKLEAYKTSLDLSKQALELSPDNINFRFNVAFVQMQLVQLLVQLPEAQRTLQDIEQADAGLDEAIDAFAEIAKSPTPPFPRGDLDARANMGRNTQKRQLAAAIEKQAEYEQKNAARLEEARKRREEEIKRREEQKRLAAEKAEEQRRKIAEERQRMAEEDAELIQRRLEEEKVREAQEWTTDEETGERKKREKKPKEKRAKRKKKDEDMSDASGAEGGRKRRTKSRATSETPGTGSDADAPRKRRKLERKGQAAKSSKYKSTEFIDDSDEDDAEQQASSPAADTPGDVDGDEEMPDEEAGEAPIKSRAQRKKPARVLDDDDEDEDENNGPGGNNADVRMAAAMEDDEDETTAAGNENNG